MDQADIVVALFGSRIGQATATALSGTAEEIQRASDGGKPVHVYFSGAGHPADVDVEQLAQLREFQRNLGGLYGTFTTLDDLKFKVWTAIDSDLDAMLTTAPADDGNYPSGVDFLAQTGSERLPKTNSKGQIRYETRRWVDLTNRGDRDAENVRVEAEGEDAHFFVMWGDPITIQHGQTRKVPVTFTMATGRHPQLRVTWTEGGDDHSRVFDI